jgi:hypothetical protein
MTDLVNANEESTYIINVAFEDEDDNAVTPDSVTWTLTDGSGNVINNRLHVSETPATSIDIVLSGDDLAIGTNGRSRTVTIEAVYDSAAGNDLPLNDEVTFNITDLTHIPD